MDTYGKVLKKLIDFTGTKLSSLAEIVGYDDSYISKWCSQAKLPAMKLANEINRNMARYFSQEILDQETEDTYYDQFDPLRQKKDVEGSIYLLLKSAYHNSRDQHDDKERKATVHQPRILLNTNDIYHFFNVELADLIESKKDDTEIYCTFDICQQLASGNPLLSGLRKAPGKLNMKMGLNQQIMHEQATTMIPALYAYICENSHIHFDFYDNRMMKTMNIFMIKDQLAAICSLNQYGRIQSAVILTDPDQVRQIYKNLVPAFRINLLLVHATDSEEFYMNGYRTEFYAKNSYSIFLTKGFEYLLPPGCFDSISAYAHNELNDPKMADIIPKLKITWEEIFENGSIDFFTLKSSLMKYLEDGEIIMADVVYRMSVDERKAHIDNVLRILDKNPNIRFYIIDDEYIPDAAQRIHISTFSNHRKMFLKDPERYNSSQGPFFYSILSEQLIQDADSYFEHIKQSDLCYTYDRDRAVRFVEKYGSMIYRILALSK